MLKPRLANKLETRASTPEWLYTNTDNTLLSSFLSSVHDDLIDRLPRRDHRQHLFILDRWGIPISRGAC